MSAIKSVLLKGNFKEKPLSYRLCPNSEFSSGAWNLSISSISYACDDKNFKSTCSITCNFVRGQKLSQAEDSVLTYQMPLTLFTIETGTKLIQNG